MLTIGLSIARVRVLLVDVSTEGGAGVLLFGTPPAPHLRDVLAGKVRLPRAVGIYAVEYEGEDYEFGFVSNRGQLPRVELDPLFSELKRLEGRYFDVIIIDLPAYQDPWYEGFVKRSEVVVKVVEPNPAAIGAAVRAWPPEMGDGSAVVLYAVNHPRPYLRSVTERYLRELRRRFGDEAVLAIPYDYAASRLAPETLSQALLLVKEPFQDALLRLAQRIIRPRVKVSA